MSPSRRVKIGLTLLAIVIAVGTLGYVIIERANPIDALYMVMITISTVGFTEVFPLDTAGRLLTIGVIVSGVGTSFYTIGAGFEALFLLRDRRREMSIMREIHHLDNHVILCGYGRVGQGTAERLKERRAEVVIIEIDRGRYEAAIEDGFRAIEGDATANRILSEAGIERARSVIACVSEDSDNLVITLSAKALAPQVLVVSRATDPEVESKLKLAGADRVVAPQAVGADRLAALTLQPALTDFFDVVVGGRAVEFLVEEIDVTDQSSVAGLSIRDSKIREASGALILAVEDRNRTMLVNPDPELVLTAGQKIICVGTKAQVDAASQML
ncbi:MAG: potassium channel protein [Acidimicrobiia bacterium]